MFDAAGQDIPVEPIGLIGNLLRIPEGKCAAVQVELGFRFLLLMRTLIDTGNLPGIHELHDPLRGKSGP